jgi:ABC-type microcin C transport system duplicated ATPase subunit YejF
MTPVLQVDGLVKHFTVRKGFPRPVTTTVRAVDGISFAVAAGEAFGLVGGIRLRQIHRGACRVALIEPDGAASASRTSMRAAGGAALTRSAGACRWCSRIRIRREPASSIGRTLAEPLAVHGIARGERSTRRRC